RERRDEHIGTALDPLEGGRLARLLRFQAGGKEAKCIKTTRLKRLRQDVNECSVAAHAMCAIEEPRYCRLVWIYPSFPLFNVRSIHIRQIDAVLGHRTRRSVTVARQQQPVREKGQ